ncbi:MAG: Fic family protein [Chloroflexi bacterium]|nr:MAG: Fic family protein [Chloroflexota bacterium]
MRWNWQKPDWPNFSYDRTQLDVMEARFLYDSGVLFGAFKHLTDSETSQLTVELISNEALKTSAIEGEYLNRESVQSSIRHQLGLEADSPPVSPAEKGIAELMVNLYRTFGEPLTHAQLFLWHRMLLQGRWHLQDWGRYRTHVELMQVVSVSMNEIKVHFEAPPSEQMAEEMERFLLWFNQTSTDGGNRLPALIRAGITHLYFVSIHPFEDGNGRIGRALAEKSLAQSVGQPTLIALSYQIEKHKKAYYNALAQANRSNEITAWLLYFGQTILDAQAYTKLRIEFLIEKTKLFDKLRDHLNARQTKALLRMFGEGPEGFAGGLSASNYSGITKASKATATRDLQDLVEKGALVKIGDRKSTRYYLAVRLS